MAAAWSSLKRATEVICREYERHLRWWVNLVNVYRAKVGKSELVLGVRYPAADGREEILLWPKRRKRER